VIQSTSLERKSDTATHPAKTGGVYSLIQTNQIFATKPFGHLYEDYVPVAFDFLMWRRSSTTVRNAQNESAQ